LKNIIIIGGSKGIGKAIIAKLIDSNSITNFSRTEPELSHDNLQHYSLNILNEELPIINEVDTLIYCPGSINLKPINRLSIDDFRTDFEINVIGGIKTIQHFLPK